MCNKIFKIEILDEKSSCIVMNFITASKLGISNKKIINLGFGNKFHITYIEISMDLNENLVMISNNICEYLHLPLFVEYEIVVKENNILFGPYIGILLGKNGKNITQRTLKRISKYTIRYHELNGAVVAFALDKIDLSNNTLEGYCYDPKDNKWEAGIFPLPTVLFRRIGLSDGWKNYFLSNLGDKVFNSYYMNKWETFCWLSNEEKLKESIPYTVKYNETQNIHDMLSKYNTIVIKPISGMKGREIYKVEKKQGAAKIEFRENSLNKMIILNSCEELERFLISHLLPERFIAQQYIELLKIRNRIIDFRVIMQKGIYGHWNCNGIVARMGEEKSIVSNISSRGKAYKLQDLMVNIMKLSEAEAFSIKEDIVRFAHMVCSALDNYGLNYGTLGLDIGIDVQGKIWLIEINSRDPDPTIALDITDTDLYYKIKSEPLLYAKYLSGFGR